MQNSFRPVALRLPLSDVAALAAATARSLTGRWRRDRTLVFAFRLRLRLALAGMESGWTKAPALPVPVGDSPLRS